MLRFRGIPSDHRETDAYGVAFGDYAMIFVLVNQDGYLYGKAMARLNCRGTADSSAAALTSTAYLPLQVGNQWIFRVNSRSETSGYAAWTLTGTQPVGDQTWFVLDMGSGGASILVRADEQGRILRLTNCPGDSHEEVYLDPSRGPATLAVESLDAPVNTPAGVLPVGLTYQAVFDGIDRERGTYARGIGLLSSSTLSLTGSSGGFLLYLTTPASGVELSAESTRVGQAKCTAPVQAIADLELRNAAGTALYSRPVALTIPAERCEAAVYHQVPRVMSGAGEIGTASVPLRVE